MPDDPRRWFKAFHAGTAPTWVEHHARTPRWLADLGPAVGVAYLRPTPRGEELRVHAFAPHARPTLARNDLGELDFVGGSYSVKEAGIVDNQLARRDPREGFKALTAQRMTPQGIPVHGRQTPREGVMIPRANPIGLVELRQGGSRLVDAGVIGGTAVVTHFSADAIVERTTWGEGTRSVASLVGGALPGALLLLTDAHVVGAGMIAGGITSGGLRFARAKQLDRWIARGMARLFPARARDGAALFDNDTGGADVRVESVAMG